MDYQWPIVTECNYFEFNTQNNYIDIDSYKEIEAFFSEKFNTRCYLFSSGRAAISAVLKYYNINRSKIVYAPRWSSHCLWDAVSRHSDPTCIYDDNVDVSINVNKWGFIHKLETSGIKINDSVDSLLLPNYKLDDDVEFEIISLPKIIGSYSGGLILTNVNNLEDYVSELRSIDNDVSRKAAEFKYKSILNSEDYDYWHSLESKNYSLDLNMTENIKANLVNFEINKETIQKRLDVIAKNISHTGLTMPEDRSPANFPVKVKEKVNENLQYTMVRHFNFSQDYNDQEFYPAYLVPLHFGVEDELFSLILDEVSHAI